MVRARSVQVRTPLRRRVPVRGPADARAAARRGRAGRPRAAAVGGVPRRAAEPHRASGWPTATFACAPCKLLGTHREPLGTHRRHRPLPGRPRRRLRRAARGAAAARPGVLRRPRRGHAARACSQARDGRPPRAADAARASDCGSRVPALPRHFLTGAELGRGGLTSILDRALALKQAPAGSRRAGGPLGRAAVRAALDAHADVVEAGVVRARRPPDGPARQRAAAHARGVGARHGARVLPPRGRDRAAHRAATSGSTSWPSTPPCPVVNLLSPLHHPCQALADLMTLREAFGAIEGRRLAYVGDGNNVARSLAILGALAGVEVAVAAPDGYQLEEAHGARLTADPAEAVAGADAVYTDVWVSMSDSEDEAAARREALAPYRLDDALLDRAAPGAFALHCLPAHPGEEITEAVLYGDRQRIWDQAENRRHVFKALLEFLVSAAGRVRARCPPASRPAARRGRKASGRAQGVARRRAAPPPEAAREQLQRFLDPREVVVVTRDAAAGGARRGGRARAHDARRRGDAAGGPAGPRARADRRPARGHRGPAERRRPRHAQGRPAPPSACCARSTARAAWPASARRSRSSATTT